MEIKKLTEKKGGHPCLLGRELDNQLQEYVKGLKEGKSVINIIISVIVISTALGIVKNHNSDLLEVNGWSHPAFQGMGKEFLG